MEPQFPVCPGSRTIPLKKSVHWLTPDDASRVADRRETGIELRGRYQLHLVLADQYKVAKVGVAGRKEQCLNEPSFLAKPTQDSLMYTEFQLQLDSIVLDTVRHQL